MIQGCRGSWKFRRWKPWLSPDVGEILWLVERSGGRDGAWGSGALAGGEGEILGPVNLLRRIRESRVYVPLFGGRKLRSVIMAREQAELWKTRDNGGKAAWLFIGVLSSVYWVSDVITDDELAVLIMRACSSRNLFVKHHLCASNVTPTAVRFIVSVFLCVLCSCRMSSTQMTCSHFRKNRPKKRQKPAGCRSRIISKNRPVPIFGRSTGASLIYTSFICFCFWWII